MEGIVGTPLDARSASEGLGTTSASGWMRGGASGRIACFVTRLLTRLGRRGPPPPVIVAVHDDCCAARSRQH